MATQRFWTVKNTTGEPPKNFAETTIKFNFEKDAYEITGKPKLALTITDYEWSNAEYDIIYQHWKDGKTFEGIPMQYQLKRGGDLKTIFDGYIDLSDKPKFNRNSVVVTAKQKRNVDWLNDTADSISFEHLKGLGIITEADYLQMPYILNRIPDYEQAAIAILSSAYLIQQLNQVVKEIADITTDAANPLTTPNAVVKLIFYIIYLIILLTAAVLLVIKLIKYIIQPVKYHACMNVRTILEKGSSYFGFTFNSEILSTAPFNKLTFMPEKYLNPFDTNQGILGFTQPQPILQRGYPTGTYGDFLRAIKKVFRCKMVIDGDFNLTLIPEWQNSGSPQFVLPDIYQPEFTTNSSDLKANYAIEFLVDIEDKNTAQEYLGTAVQVITTLANPVDPFLNTLKDIDLQQLPFALAKRKTELSVPEKIFSDLCKAAGDIINAIVNAINDAIKVINKVIKAINNMIKALKTIGIKIKFQIKEIPKMQNVSLGNLIDNRINMMKIETDLISVPKLFLMDVGSQSKFNKLTANNEIIVAAKYLYVNYHAQSVSFLPSAERPNGNQYIIKDFGNDPETLVPFVFEDFIKVKNNNCIFTAQGESAIIDSGEWDDFDEKAKLNVKISSLYIPENQLIETIIEPNGK